MLSPQEQSRYSKQTILPEIGTRGQELLKAAKVLVVGAGGLGCPVLQYLVAAGVGAIGIADGDAVSISNLQRQVLYTEQEIGELKVAVAERKMNALNPNVVITSYPFFIDNGNALDIMSRYDIVVDASDNFDARYLLNDACVILGKPMVSGAIYKFEGQVSTFNYKGGPTYRCIFPEAPGAGESPNCADIGVIATLPGIIGTIQANEVIKLITGIGEVLSGRLLVIDTLTMATHSFNFKLNPANRNIKQLPAASQACDIAPKNISYVTLQELTENEHTQLVDVREPAEHAADNIGGINIPLPTLGDSLHLLQPEKTVILYCASGMRSKKAADTLLQRGFTTVYNLAGGVNGISPD